MEIRPSRTDAGGRSCRPRRNRRRRKHPHYPRWTNLHVLVRANAIGPALGGGPEVTCPVPGAESEARRICRSGPLKPPSAGTRSQRRNGADCSDPPGARLSFVSPLFALAITAAGSMPFASRPPCQQQTESELGRRLATRSIQPPSFVRGAKLQGAVGR